MQDTFGLTKEEMSYFMGLFAADGNFYEHANKGRIAFEMKASCRPLFESIREKLTVTSTVCERTRNTNFCRGFEAVGLRICGREFRDFMKEAGFVPGKKAYTVNYPTWDVDPSCFFRGYFDGDGSYGFTKPGVPFVSVLTKSDAMRAKLEEVLTELLDYPARMATVKRDKIYSFVCFSSRAQRLVGWLYGNAMSWGLPEKKQIVEDILKWKRPEGREYHGKVVWTKLQDEFILTHTVEESMRELGRTKSSVETRLYRLKLMKKNNS